MDCWQDYTVFVKTPTPDVESWQHYAGHGGLVRWLWFCFTGYLEFLTKVTLKNLAVGCSCTLVTWCSYNSGVNISRSAGRGVLIGEINTYRVVLIDSWRWHHCVVSKRRVLIMLWRSALDIQLLCRYSVKWLLVTAGHRETESYYGEMRCEDGRWMELAQDRVQWQALL